MPSLAAYRQAACQARPEHVQVNLVRRPQTRTCGRNRHNLASGPSLTSGPITQRERACSRQVPDRRLGAGLRAQSAGWVCVCRSANSGGVWRCCPWGVVGAPRGWWWAAAAGAVAGAARVSGGNGCGGGGNAGRRGLGRQGCPSARSPRRVGWAAGRPWPVRARRRWIGVGSHCVPGGSSGDYSALCHRRPGHRRGRGRALDREVVEVFGDVLVLVHLAPERSPGS